MNACNSWAGLWNHGGRFSCRTGCRRHHSHGSMPLKLSQLSAAPWAERLTITSGLQVPASAWTLK
eukprot:11173302-Lingulodinium_polyedra.AAC.1